MSAKEPRISLTALAEVEAALCDYAKEVLHAGRKPRRTRKESR